MNTKLYDSELKVMEVLWKEEMIQLNIFRKF